MAVSMSLQDKEKLAFRVFQAAIDGSPEKIQSLLSDLPLDVATDILNTSVECGGGMCTPLTMASFRGHSNVVQLLVEDYHVDINKKDRENPLDEEAVTALILAAQQGYLDIVKMLVKAGCHLDARNSSGETAVYILCQLNESEMVEYLCENGADVNIPNQEGNTCLMTSCEPGREELARILLKNGANPNVGFERKTPLPVSELDTLGRIRVLSQQREKRTTALHHAVEKHASETVKLLLLHGAQVFCDDTYQTPVDIAVTNKFLDIAEIFAASHALSWEEKLYCWKFLGQLPDSWIEMMRFFHEATKERQRQLDSLSNSCCARPTEDVYWKFEYCNFRKSFHEALKSGQALPCQCIKDLLEICLLKVELDKRVELNKRVYGFLLDEMDDFVVVCLEAILLGLKGAKGEEEERQLERPTRRLICLSPPAFRGRSLLHVGVDMMWQRAPEEERVYDLPYHRLLPFLLKCGASVHAKDNDGNRPLHVVALGKHGNAYKEMLAFETRTLLEAGALVGVRNNAGQTPLMCARNTAVAEILRSHCPPSLKSLAATEVVRKKIPFKDEIPRDLVPFVEYHIVG